MTILKSIAFCRIFNNIVELKLEDHVFEIFYFTKDEQSIWPRIHEKNESRTIHGEQLCPSL